MENLNILTRNNLGVQFWEQRSSMAGRVKINELDLTVFNQLVENENKFILVDFYFSQLSFAEEKNLIELFNAKFDRVECKFLKLFILSPFYSDQPLLVHKYETKQIVSHNYSAYFLRRLLNASQKMHLINQNQAS